MSPSRKIWSAGKIVRFFMLGLLVSGLGAQVSETQHTVGYPEDWTHHRIKFTLPGLREHPEILSREPRALHQLYRQWQAYRVPVGDVSAPGLRTPSEGRPDWSASLGAGALAFGQYPAKWTTDPTAAPSCADDYVVFTVNTITGAAGGQATLVGFNNLYSGTGTSLCGMTGPTVMFSYYTNNQFQGANTTSPVLSLDGKMVAFVESHAAQTGNPSTNSYLHVLTLGTTGNNGSSVTDAVVPGTGNNASMSTLLYAATTNTRSSPWVDYPSDTLYVGADNGTLYAIHPVFTGGTPAIVKRIAVGGTVILTSPVFDNTTGNIYMGGNGGFLYAVNVTAATPTVYSLAVGSGTPNNVIYDAPVFDSTGSRVLALSAHGENSAGTGQGAVVVQAHATGTSLVQDGRVDIGLGATTANPNVNLYDGDFDNAYFATGPASGHMLVCGTGPADTTPYRYLLDFNSSGIIQPGTSAQIVNNANARCGPVTDYFNPNINGGTDFLMWGVTTSNCGLTGQAALGCVMSFQNESTIKAVIERGGASGIIIDNDSTDAQASSFYFSTEVAAPAGTYSAVKLGQLNLN